jgi:hypothetical protein
MVTVLRAWDRLRTLSDDFSRRDMQFIVAFADSLPSYIARQNPGSDPRNTPDVRGDELPIESVMALIDDTSGGSLVRTLARQYGVDNPRDILTRALNYIGAVVPLEPMPHFSDSYISTAGSKIMKISESTMRHVVHRSIFGEGDAQPDIHPGGMYVFAVKIQFSTPETETPRTEHLSIRASSPEEAKSMASRIAADKNYKDFSVIDIETVAYSGPGQPGLVPHTAPTNVQPGALDGQVEPSDVSPVLPNVGVAVPKSGHSGGNLTGGV